MPNETPEEAAILPCTAGQQGELPRKDVPRRLLWAWASLDFANSGYTTVVLTAVFNAYFVSTVWPDPTQGTLVWTLILSASYALIMLTAPWVGAHADLRGSRWVWLVACTALCGLGTLGLLAVGPGDAALAAVLLLVSNLAYAHHQSLTAAYLCELAPEGRRGRVSGFGWAWGYLGGLLALALAVAWVRLGPEGTAVAGSLLITAVMFWVVGFLALAVLRGHRPAVVHAAAPVPWQGAWARLLSDWRQDSQQGHLRSFLWVVLVYQAGVSAVITLAAVYAQQAMGFGMADTLQLILLVNIAAALGAWGLGLLQDRLGHFRTLGISLCLWVGMVVLAAASTQAWVFWLAALLAGLAMGSSQAGARALLADWAEPGRQAEAFGYWGVAVNMSAIVGPLVYGLTTAATQGNHRLGLLVVGTSFVLGLAMLWRLKRRVESTLVLQAHL